MGSRRWRRAVAVFVAIVATSASMAVGPGRAQMPDAGPEPFRPSPRGALVRSTLVPGWGQLYNHRWIKGLLFAAGRIYLGWRAVDEHRLARDLEEEALALEDPAARDRKWREHNRALVRRDDFIWYSAYALLFTMAEAYVDAALMEFDDEFEEVEEIDEDAAGAGTVVRFGLALRF
jgi:hypothetical protein